mmetsp:Transcript_17067/g.52404  ORF Transcript_17067/g.52404 Transcript_17067/m.52404 type:complete len:88 (-) Transcript_17067:413-676(-)
MGLLKILRKVREQERELRLLVLGLDNAGKTTILKRFSGEDIGEIAPTLGFDIKTLAYKGYNLNVCPNPNPKGCGWAADNSQLLAKLF